MFDRGIGPGVRGSRFGTWSLLTFLLLALGPFVGGSTLLWWPPFVVCLGTTGAALAFGLAGLIVRGQRSPAVRGLLKAAPATLAVAAYVLFALALSSMSFE